MNILIVDDEESVRAMLGRMLKVEGHGILSAANGLEALAVLAREPVGLIITDIMMPHMDGYRLCQEVRRDERLRNIPFIFHTASYTEPADEKLALDLGADLFLRKPAPLATILDAVRRMTSQPRAVCPPPAVATPESEVMQAYSSRLVAKLEQRNVELNAAETRFRTLVEQSLVGIFVIQDEQFTYVNPRLTAILGTSAEVLTARPVYDFIAAEDRELARENIHRRMTGEAPSLHFDLRMLHQSGAVVQAEVNGTRTEYDGRPAVMGTLLDVTERKRAEAAGQESRQRLQAIMDHFPGLVSAKDLQGNVILVNRNFALLPGPSPEAFLGKNVHELFPKDVADALWANDLAAQRAGGPVESEESVHHKDGSLHHYLTVKFPLYQAEQMVATCAVSVDITGRKQDAAARALAEAKYRALFDHSPVGIYQTTPEGKFLAANAAMARILGFASPEELIRERTDIGAEGFVQPGRRAEFKRLIEKHGTVTAFECEVWRKNGSTAWVTESARAIRDAAGQIVCYEGTFEDITERKRAEAAVRASEQRFRALIEHSHDGIVLFGADGSVLYASPSTTNLLGYLPEELHQRNALEFVHPDSQQSVGERLAQSLRSPGVGVHSEAYVRHKDGSWRFLEGTFTNLLHEPGIGAIVNNFRDLTERKRAEQRRAAFATLGRRLNVASDATEAARIIVGIADDLFGWDSCKVDLYDAQTDQCRSILTMDVVRGQRQEVAPAYSGTAPSPRLRPAIEKGPQLILRQEPITLPPDSRAFGDASRPSASMMEVPLREGGAVIGVLAIQSYRVNAYTRDDLTALQDLADHCAGALKRIAAESALRESGERLRLAVHASNLGLWDWDVRTNEVVFSREWKSQLGYAEHEISNAFSEWESRVHPDDLAPALERVRRALASAEEVYEVEFRMRHKDGSWRWIYTRAEVFRDPQGQAVRLIGCHVDITERKRTEHRQAAFAKLGRRLNAATDETEAARIIADTADELFGWDSCKVDFYDTQTDRSRSILSVDVINGERQELSPALSDTLPSPRLRKVVTTGALLILRQEPITLSPDSTPFGDKSRPSASIMAVPIREAGRIVGVLAIQSYRLNAYTNEDLAALQDLADHCAGALERIRSRFELERQRAELALILDTVPGIIFHKDLNRRFVRVNEAFARALGMPRAAIEGRTGAELGSTHEEHYLRDDDEVMRTGQPKLGIIEPMHTPAGTRWLQTDKLPYRDEHGNITGVLGFALDITERRQAEEALRVAEEKYHSIFEHAVEGIYQSTPEGRYLTVNPAMAGIYGYASPEEMVREITDIGRQIYADPEDRRKLQALLHAQGGTGVFECQTRRRDGALIWVRQSSRAVRDASGQVICYEGSAEDITERKQAEESLRRQHALVTAVVEGTSDAVFAKDLAGQYLIINTAGAQALGRPAAEILGHTDAEFVPEATARRFREADELVVASGQMQTQEETGLMGGQTRSWHANKAPLRDAEGRIVGIIGVSRDITELKRAQAELVLLSGKLLRAQDEERRRLAREIHDSTAQTFAALAMNLAVLGRITPGMDDASRALLAECEIQVRRGTAELRTRPTCCTPPRWRRSG